METTIFESVCSEVAPPIAKTPRYVLANRVLAHLKAYAELQSMLELGAPLDTLLESRNVVLDAKSLAEQIALIPDYREIEPLWEAFSALLDHWRSSWTNSGISCAAYRSRLKALLLFLRLQMPFAH